jgi:hypothetical protein
MLVRPLCRDIRGGRHEIDRRGRQIRSDGGGVSTRPCSPPRSGQRVEERCVYLSSSWTSPQPSSSSPSRLVRRLFGHHGHLTPNTRVFRGTSMPTINTRQTKRSLPRTRRGEWEACRDVACRRPVILSNFEHEHPGYLRSRIHSLYLASMMAHVFGA